MVQDAFLAEEKDGDNRITVRHEIKLVGASTKKGLRPEGNKPLIIPKADTVTKFCAIWD